MPLERQIAAFAGEVEILAGINIGNLWNRMTAEFMGEYERLARQKLTDAQLEAGLRTFIGDLSEKPIDDLARKSSRVAYNQGRNAEILSAAEERDVQFVVRSEVLDTSTCRPCQLLDSEVFEIDSPEYFANLPPAGCDGGDRCRGFYIAIGGAGSRQDDLG